MQNKSSQDGYLFNVSSCIGSPVVLWLTVYARRHVIPSGLTATNHQLQLSEEDEHCLVVKYIMADRDSDFRKTVHTYTQVWEFAKPWSLLPNPTFTVKFTFALPSPSNDATPSPIGLEMQESGTIVTSLKSLVSQDESTTSRGSGGSATSTITNTTTLYKSIDDGIFGTLVELFRTIK